MADQLAQLSECKLRIGITDGTDDALLTDLLEGVSDWIEEFTGRQLVSTGPGVVWTVDTSPGSVIEIPRGVQAVTLLEVANADQPDTGGTYTTIAAADTLLRPEPMYRKVGWPATRIVIRGTTARLTLGYLNGARITGTFGWAVTPPAIQELVKDAVGVAYATRKNAGSAAVGADGTTVFPWSSYFTRGSPQRGTLERFRAGKQTIGIA